MFFLLTKFVHPIDKKIVLSKHFGFYFDNPRSKEEIAAVRGMIKKSWDLSDIYDGFQYQRFPMNKEVPGADVVTFESIIEKFCHAHFSKKETKKIITDLEGNPDKIIDFYTRHWVIVRYENAEMKAENKRLKKISQANRKRGERNLIMVDDDHIFERRNEEIIDFSALVSLLSAKEDYFGWTFLLTESRDSVRDHSPRIPIMHCILMQMIGVTSRVDDPSAREFNFTSFIKETGPFISVIDDKFKSKAIDEDVLLYIGSVLTSSTPSGNEFSSLVRLVGIMEMLLTHQPDFNRVNVDESITKQFILKTATIAYMADKMISLEKTKTNLKEIYSQRSNIVHGNFKEVNKFVKKLKTEDRHFSSLVSDCYSYAKLSVRKYLEEPEFAKFLKES